MNTKKFLSLFLTLIILLNFSACIPMPYGTLPGEYLPEQLPDISAPQEFSLDLVPAYSGKPYAVINNNIPYFSSEDLRGVSFEYYSDLDNLGRCGTAFACIGIDIMPTGERGAIGQIKPTGWHTVKYDNVDGKYLYNRCHLIGYQLSAENANEKNLITGTRYLNIEGMLPFENMTADYINETHNHVLYRVTPIFEEDNLLASGVLMEAMSVEDSGKGICFNVYCYNVQPGVVIDYKSGDSYLEETEEESFEDEESYNKTQEYYIGNKNSKKFHRPYCRSVDQMNFENMELLDMTREEAIERGYVPCKICSP